MTIFTRNSVARSGSILALSLFCAGILSCAASPATQNSPLTLTAGDFQTISNQLAGKKPVYFRDFSQITQTSFNESTIKIIITHAIADPSLAIRLSYIDESGLAKTYAQRIQQQVSNQVYLDDCCSFDRGRMNLPSGSVTITFYH